MTVFDTGVLLAAVNDRDEHHQMCVEVFATAPGPLLVPASVVVVETCWMLESRRGSHSEAQFLRSLRMGALEVIDLSPADYDRSAQLIEQYANLPLGLADASVIAIAERLNVTTVATLARRHFTVVRPRHTPTLTLLPHLYQ